MTSKIPFYIRSTIILFGLILMVYALYYLGDILVPLAFAGMLAIILNPVYCWLNKKKSLKFYLLSSAW